MVGAGGGTAEVLVLVLSEVLEEVLREVLRAVLWEGCWRLGRGLYLRVTV